MSVPSAPLDVARLRDVLQEHPFITQVYYRPQLGSTNDVARRQAGEGAPEGLLVVADEQTAGRGRRGRTWWAPAGTALLTSLLFRPALAADRVQQITMVCALAAADAITAITTLPVELKWPNDLLIKGRKVAGLLSEARFKGNHPDFVVAGMGMNVNMDFSAAPALMAPATSLQRELGQPVERVTLLAEYIDRVAGRYRRLQAGGSPHEEWAERLSTVGQAVRVEQAERMLSGTAEGVDASGALLLRTANRELHRLLAADVTVRQGKG